LIYTAEHRNRNPRPQQIKAMGFFGALKKSVHRCFTNVVQRGVFYIASILLVISLTIIGGTYYILKMADWTNYKIRTSVEGEFPTNTSHYKLHKKFELPDERDIDTTVQIMTIVVEINMVTTALSVLTTLALFCVMSKEMAVNKSRRNAVLPYLIWNSVAILYNVIVLIYISIKLKKFIAQLSEITLSMTISAAVDFVFLIIVTAYYRFLEHVTVPDSPALLMSARNGSANHHRHHQQTDDIDEVEIPEALMEEFIERRLSLQKPRPFKGENKATF